jgi:hypothetical protein
LVDAGELDRPRLSIARNAQFLSRSNCDCELLPNGLGHVGVGRNKRQFGGNERGLRAGPPRAASPTQIQPLVQGHCHLCAFDTRIIART